jgi:hypothetical protein
MVSPKINTSRFTAYLLSFIPETLRKFESSLTSVSRIWEKINRFYRYIDPACNHQDREFKSTFVSVSSPPTRPERVPYLCLGLNNHTTQNYVRNLLTDGRAFEDNPVSSKII